ncbi:MAG: HEAT repeat domain-containing protein [Calothrix sp. C42_A2020_038]|nr:HEAT repeat domain-containing protein [Calothrix sp. C42_A2020_038]
MKTVRLKDIVLANQIQFQAVPALRQVSIVIALSPLFLTPLYTQLTWAQSANPSAINSYIQQLGNPSQKQQAFKSLVSIGKPAVQALITALQHQNPEVRAQAATALAQIGNDAAPALPALSRALQDQDERVRGAAVEAFGSIGKRAMIPYLVANLKHENASVRYNAAHGLTRLGNYAESAVPTLTETLQDQETWVRLTAATALGNIGVRALSSLPALVKSMEDKDISVRHSAAYALGSIGTDVQEKVKQVSAKDLDTAILYLEKGLQVAVKPNLEFRQQAISSVRTPLNALKQEKSRRKITQRLSRSNIMSD